jgi:uncharacterized protein (DUF2062 family)
VKKAIDYFNRKVMQPLMALLKAGATPQKLALSVAFGCIIGIFPIFATTLICIFIAFIFRLNHAAIQIANYAVYALQFILFIPFIQLGLFIMGKSISTEKLEEMVDWIATDIWLAMGEVGEIFLAGLLGWGIVAIPVFAIIYPVTFWFFKKAHSRWSLTAKEVT